jgi:predicted Zn-dependent peptidase
MKQRDGELELHRTTLDNGVRVVSAPRPQLSRAHVVVALQGGPVHETDGTWGMSHVLEHMVFRGTKAHRDARAVSLAADDFGGEIGGTTYRDRVHYDTRADEGRVGEALELLGEMLFSPRFEGLAVEKEILREELLEQYNDDGELVDADNLAASELFAGDTLARSIEGTLEGLEGLDRAGLKRFHRSAYGPEHLVVTGAGALEHDELVRAAESVFGALPPGEGPPAGEAPPSGAGEKRGEKLLVVDDDESQTSVRLSFPCVGFGDPRRTAVAALGRVLDDGPAARLPARLIDAEGLAYDLWCDVDLYAHRGAFDLGAQVAHDRVGQLVESLCRELARLRQRGPTKDELQRIRARLERDLSDMRDDPADVADAIAHGELLGVPFSPERLRASYASLTPVDVRDCAREVLRAEQAVLVLVGRPKKKEVKRAQKALRELSS